MKPLDGNFARNALKHGVSGLNIEGCRVSLQDGEQKATTTGRRTVRWGVGEGDSTYQKGVGWKGTSVGRFPANVIHDGSEGVVGLFPANAGASAPVRGKEPSTTGQKGIYGHFDRVAGPFHGDSGSASRFFKEANEK